MLKVISWPFRALFSFLISNIFSKTSLVLAILVALFFGYQLFTFVNLNKDNSSKGVGGNAKDILIEGEDLYVIDTGIKKRDWTDITPETDPVIWLVNNNSLEFQKVITNNDTKYKEIIENSKSVNSSYTIKTSDTGVTHANGLLYSVGRKRNRKTGEITYRFEAYDKFIFSVGDDVEPVKVDPFPEAERMKITGIIVDTSKNRVYFRRDFQNFAGLCGFSVYSLKPFKQIFNSVTEINVTNNTANPCPSNMRFDGKTIYSFDSFTSEKISNIPILAFDTEVKFFYLAKLNFSPPQNTTFDIVPLGDKYFVPRGSKVVVFPQKITQRGQVIDPTSEIVAKDLGIEPTYALSYYVSMTPLILLLILINPFTGPIVIPILLISWALLVLIVRKVVSLALIPIKRNKGGGKSPPPQAPPEPINQKPQPYSPNQQATLGLQDKTF